MSERVSILTVALFAVLVSTSSFVFLPAFASTSTIAGQSTVKSPQSSALITAKSRLWAGYGVYKPGASQIVTEIQSSFVQPRVICNKSLKAPQTVFILAAIDGVAVSTEIEFVG